MDIYSLINSKAISVYCRKIGHQFSSLEIAYLVYANDSMNVMQKHAAFDEIIEHYSDMEVAERTWTPYAKSLHGFLKIYMELQNKYISLFYRDEPGCIYSYEIWYASDEEYSEDPRIFADWDSCYEAIKSDIGELAEAYKDSDIDVSPLDIRVTKQWINVRGDEHPKCIKIRIDPDNHPVEIWEDRCVISEEDNAILSAFDGLWPEIPTPFEKGDILVCRTRKKQNGKPFVLDRIPYWEENGKYASIVSCLREIGDSTDLTTSIYGQDEDGAIWHDHGPSYLDMEYCEQELEGMERFLVAVRNHLKDELPLELLIRAYDILKAECHAKEEHRIIGSFYGDLLNKAGLEADQDADATGNSKGIAFKPF